MYFQCMKSMKRGITPALVLLCVLLLIVKWQEYQQNQSDLIIETADPGPERPSKSTPTKVTDLSRLKEIISACGELCDLTKPVKPPKNGDFMGTVQAEVKCDNLFTSDILDRSSDVPPRRWNEIPKDLQILYNHGGVVEIKDKFFDTAKDGGGRTEAKVFSKQEMEKRLNSWKSQKSINDTYKNGASLVDRAAAQVEVANKTILVIGTQDPWLETVLLARNPARIITLEYGTFKSEYSSWEFVLPWEFRNMYMNGSLPIFDLVFSYSSVEHSGLGRYGDSLNPFGDIMTIARAWCVSSPKAKLVLGVPTHVVGPQGTEGIDRIEFNAHRIYGPRLYPFLTTNWKFSWPTKPEERNPKRGAHIASFQPVYIFDKLL